VPKTYRLQYLIDDALARAAYARGVKGFGDIESAALRAAKAAESALNGVAKAGETAAKSHANGHAQAARNGAAAVRGVWKQAENASAAGFKVVEADVRKLDALFKKDKGFYIPPGGGADVQKYKNAVEFVKKAMAEGIPIEMPRLTADKNSASFDDGRHRFAAMRDLGYRKIPVSVDPMAAEATKAAIGATAAHQAVAAAAVKSATAQTAAVNRVVAAATNGAAQRVRAEVAAQERVDVGLHKLQVNGIKFQDSLTKAAEKGAAERERVFDRAEKREHDRMVREAKARESFMAGPNGRNAAMQAAAPRRRLNDEQVALAAQVRAVDVLNKKAVDARLAMMGLRDSFAEGISQGIGLSGAATKAGAALLAMGAAKSVILGVAGALQEARKESERLGVNTLDFLKRLRPLASVLGTTPGPDLARKVTEFGVNTGMGQAKAAEFLETFSGRANIVKGKTISDAEFDKFTVAAGKLATAKGIPTEAAADLFSQVLKIENFKAKGQGAAEAAARGAGLVSILDAGAGKLPQLAPQAVELMAALASENQLEGTFRNAGEVGVLTSVMAEKNPAEASVFGRALVRSLSDFKDKDKAEFFKQTGITPGMPAFEKIERTNKLLADQQAKGKSLEETLSTFGLANEERGKIAIMTAFKARDTVLKPQLERLASFEKPGAAAAVEKSVAERFRQPDIQSSQAEARKELAQLAPAGVPAAVERQKAEARIGTELDTTWAGTISKRVLDAFSLGIGRRGRDALIESEAVMQAQRRAGVEVTGLSPFQATYGDNSELLAVLKKIADTNDELVRQGKKASATPANPTGGPTTPVLPPIPAPLPLGRPSARPLR
jgi:hypothetical protein